MGHNHDCCRGRSHQPPTRIMARTSRAEGLSPARPLTGATSSCAHHTLAHGIFPIRPPQPAREGRLFAVGRGGKAPPPSIPGRNTDDLIARSTHLRPQISP